MCCRSVFHHNFLSSNWSTCHELLQRQTADSQLAPCHLQYIKMIQVFQLVTCIECDDAGVPTCHLYYMVTHVLLLVSNTMKWSCDFQQKRYYGWVSCKTNDMTSCSAVTNDLCASKLEVCNLKWNGTFIMWSDRKFTLREMSIHQFHYYPNIMLTWMLFHTVLNSHLSS